MNTVNAKDMKANDNLQTLILEALQKAKAFQIDTFDFGDSNRLFEKCILCSGSSKAHVLGIAAKVEEELKEKNIRPLGVEGTADSLWVLMDLNTVLVHIFLEEVRANYSLEKLYEEWSNYSAKKVNLFIPNSEKAYKQSN